MLDFFSLEIVQRFSVNQQPRNQAPDDVFHATLLDRLIDPWQVKNLKKGQLKV